MHTYIDERRHRYTHKHTQTHKHTHTHIHTQTTHAPISTCASKHKPAQQPTLGLTLSNSRLGGSDFTSVNSCMRVSNFGEYWWWGAAGDPTWARGGGGGGGEGEGVGVACCLGGGRSLKDVSSSGTCIIGTRVLVSASSLAANGSTGAWPNCCAICSFSRHIRREWSLERLTSCHSGSW